MSERAHRPGVGVARRAADALDAAPPGEALRARGAERLRTGVDDADHRRAVVPGRTIRVRGAAGDAARVDADLAGVAVVVVRADVGRRFVGLAGPVDAGEAGGAAQRAAAFGHATDDLRDPSTEHEADVQRVMVVRPVARSGSISIGVEREQRCRAVIVGSRSGAHQRTLRMLPMRVSLTSPVFGALQGSMRDAVSRGGALLGLFQERRLTGVLGSLQVRRLKGVGGFS